MGKTGFQINHSIERVDKSIINGFKKLPTPNIGDVMGRFRALEHSIKPINNPGIHVAGSAFTVQTHPSDNLMVHKALDLAHPGDIIIIDAFGDMGNAILGELMCHYAKFRGVSGFIVDGPVRDLLGITKMEYPVFAKGGSPRGPYKEGPGEINTIISCGGVTVKPGDVIVGDDDGVIVVPKEDAKTILEEATAHAEKEGEIIKSIYKGEWDRSWVDEALNRKGCFMGD